MRSTVFNGVKVFSATVGDARNALGDRVTDWLRANPRCAVVDARVLQSSDEKRHCLTVVLFYAEA